MTANNNTASTSTTKFIALKKHDIKAELAANNLKKADKSFFELLTLTSVEDCLSSLNHVLLSKNKHFAQRPATDFLNKFVAELIKFEKAGAVAVAAAHTVKGKTFKNQAVSALSTYARDYLQAACGLTTQDNKGLGLALCKPVAGLRKQLSHEESVNFALFNASSLSVSYETAENYGDVETLLTVTVYTALKYFSVKIDDVVIQNNAKITMTREDASQLQISLHHSDFSKIEFHNAKVIDNKRYAAFFERYQKQQARELDAIATTRWLKQKAQATIEKAQKERDLTYIAKQVASYASLFDVLDKYDVRITKHTDAVDTLENSLKGANEGLLSLKSSLLANMNALEKASSKASKERLALAIELNNTELAKISTSIDAIEDELKAERLELANVQALRAEFIETHADELDTAKSLNEELIALGG